MSSNNNENIQNNDCFIIMPISDPNGYDSGHFKKIYDDIFKPACKNAGLNPIRADDVAESGMIHISILQKLLQSRMAICDLSSHNPNVLFELGIRQAFDKPTVLVQEEGTKPIFDIAPLKYCTYRKNHLYREVLEDQKKITDFLVNTSASLEKGEILNSIVELLHMNKAVMGENTTETSTIYKYFMSEFDQLKLEIRKSNSFNVQSNENEDNYEKILTSLKQLSEMVKNGTPNNIFNKNYSELREQIMSLGDSDIRNMLLGNLDDIKGEHEKYL